MSRFQETAGAVSLADLEGIGVAAGVTAKQEVNGNLALLQENVELRGDGVLAIVHRDAQPILVGFGGCELHDAVDTGGFAC